MSRKIKSVREKKTAKKILSLLLCAALCVPAVIPFHEAAAIVQAAEGQKSIPEGYTPIYTIDDLIGINNDTSGNYILMNDIDMTEATKAGGSWDTGHGWTPLNRFSGIFNGNGYRIIGMNIYGDPGDYAGLFSQIDCGLVYNLGMKDVTIDCSSACCGAIAGTVYGYKKVTIGGREDQLSIWKCYTSGESIRSSSSREYKSIGGLVGRMWDGGPYIEDCYNTASVEGEGIFGGSNVRCYRCYNIGDVTGCQIGPTGSSHCYGLMNKSPNTDYCTIRTETQMKTQNTYTGFDFDDVWMIDPYSNYPYPQLRSNPHIKVTKMEVAKLPNQVEFQQSKELDLSGGQVTLYYEDGRETTVAMDEKMLKKYNMDVIGSQDVILSWGGAVCSFPIEVKGIAVQDIELTAVSENVSKGGTLQIQAKVIPEDATNQTLTWSSNYPDIAKVDNNGRVTGVKVGAAEITVTAINGISKVYTVIVTEPCRSVRILESEYEYDYDDDYYDYVIPLNLGEEMQLHAEKSPIDAADELIWESSDESVVTVKNGTVKAVGSGYADVIVHAGECRDERTVRVHGVSEFYFEESSEKLYKGESLSVKPIVYNTKGELVEGAAIQYKSSDETVVTVDNEGKITALKEGEAEIKAYLSMQLASYTVKVIDPEKVDKLTFSSKKKEIAIGQTLQKKVKAYNAEGKELEAAITYESSDETVATVDGEGNVTGLKEGTVKITATHNNTSVSCKVTVIDLNRPDKIVFSKSKIDLLEGQSIVLSPKVCNVKNKQLNTAVTYASENTDIATVDNNGKVTALKIGSVKITATTGSISKSCTIKVIGEIDAPKITKKGKKLKIKTLPKAKVVIKAKKKVLGKSKVTVKTNSQGVAKVTFKKKIGKTKVYITVSKSGYKTKKVKVH